MCKSGIQYDADSDSDDDGIFQSATERSTKQNVARLPRSGQSRLALTFTIGQGLLTMYTPVRDVSANVIPGQHGELIVRLEDATIFSVNLYKGNPNLGYVCAMVKTLSLYHCGLTTTPSQTPPLRPINSVVSRHCQPAIYRSEVVNVFPNSTDKDMLVVAVRIQPAHQTHRIKVSAFLCEKLNFVNLSTFFIETPIRPCPNLMKGDYELIVFFFFFFNLQTFRVAVGIRDSTLRHRVCQSQTSWFTELMDALDVVDHPVAGYSPPGVLTELHLHLWDCAVDYR